MISLLLQGYVPTQSILYASVLPSIPFIALVLALLFIPGLRGLDQDGDPLGSIDPPAPRWPLPSDFPNCSESPVFSGPSCWWPLWSPC